MIAIVRRTVLALVLLQFAAPSAAFDLDTLERRAAALAAAPYRPDTTPLPAFLEGLDYDAYRDIRFRPDRALWRAADLPFQAQLFSRGFYFKDRVQINVIEGRRVAPLPFAAELFDYGRTDVPAKASADTGFAGFRLHYPLNRPDYHDELAVFLGASYFRALARGQAYGLSMRGLAIDAGAPTPEEFPVFREFWLERPAPAATAITLYALLDGPGVAGAWRFVITPGAQTVMEVAARLHLRRDVGKLGIAPLTSMFFHGEHGEPTIDDFRPEVHDSDGLLVVTRSGERLWRPLRNPARLALTVLALESPRAFGLLQRDRDFEHYQDLEAAYERRPSALVEPLGDWGPGHVELLELASDSERNDNIVAQWVPMQPARKGARFAFDYRLRFADDPEAGTGGRVVATHSGHAGTVELDATRRKFVVDFAGPALAGLAPETKLEAHLDVSGAQASAPVVERNPHSGGWRVHFEVTPAGPAPVELRCALRSGADYLTETWLYQWLPPR